MRKISLALSFVLIGVLLASGFQAQAPAQAKKIDVSGVWEMTIDTPQGSMPPSDATFEQQGEALKITMKSPQGEDLNCEGKIKADAIEWTLSISSPRGDMTIIFKGKVEGETMSGQAEMGDFGSMAWKASKKK
jgi:hypothetical protein